MRAHMRPYMHKHRPHGARCECLVQCDHEILVEHVAACARLPSVPPPALHPFGEGIDRVRAVGKDAQRRLRVGTQLDRTEDRQQLGTVVALDVARESSCHVQVLVRWIRPVDAVPRHGALASIPARRSICVHGCAPEGRHDVFTRRNRVRPCRLGRRPGVRCAALGACRLGRSAALGKRRCFRTCRKRFVDTALKPLDLRLARVPRLVHPWRSPAPYSVKLREVSPPHHAPEASPPHDAA